MSVSVALSSFSGTNVSTGIDISHAHVGTPKGVLVTIIERAPTGDRISGVTYGGESLVEVTTGVTTASPIIYTNAEPFTIHYFFLGTSVPAGTQTATISPSSAGGRLCVVTTFDGAADLEINDLESLADTSEADPSYTFGLGGTESLVMIGFGSGYSAVGNVSPYTGWSEEAEFDLGSSVAGVYSYDTVGTSDPTDCGYNTSGADDVSLSAIAINEISGGSTTHTGTGGLSSAASTMSGSGSSFTVESGTGGLSSAASSLTVTANAFSILSGTGSLVTNVSTIAGVGEVVHSGSGALTSNNVTLTSTASVIRTGSGTLNSQDVVLTAVAALVKNATGNLANVDSSITATAEVVRAGTGTLNSADATIDGASVGVVSAAPTLTVDPSTISGSGARVVKTPSNASLISNESTLSVTATVVKTALGTLNSTQATLSGSGATFALGAGTGSLTSPNGSSITATVDIIRKSSNDTLASSSSSLTVTSNIIRVSNSDNIGADSSTINGSGLGIVTGVGTLTVNSAEIDAVIVKEVSGTGALNSSDSAVFGAGGDIVIIIGDLVADSAVLNNTGVVFTTIDITEAIQADSANIVGVGTVSVLSQGTGNLAAGDSDISGAGINSNAILVTGNLQSEVSTLSGVGSGFTVNVSTSDNLQSTSSSLTVDVEAFTIIDTVTADLQVSSSTMSTAGERVITGYGDLVHQLSNMSATVELFKGVSGNLRPNPSGISGTGLKGKTYTSLRVTANSSSLSGQGIAFSTLTGTGNLISGSPLISLEVSTEGDITPVDFTFGSLTTNLLDTITEASETITITGLNLQVPISIDGGEYSIDGGAFTTQPGVISNNQTLQVRLLSGNAMGVVSTTTITVSDYVTTFVVTTSPGIETSEGQPLCLTSNYGTYPRIVGKINNIEFHTEDALEVLVQLTRRWKSFEINPTAEVSCRLVSTDRQNTYTDISLQTSTQNGADWANSLINLIIPREQMQALKDELLPWNICTLPCFIEIEIRDTHGTKTFYTRVLLIKHLILEE